MKSYSRRFVVRCSVFSRSALYGLVIKLLIPGVVDSPLNMVAHFGIDDQLRSHMAERLPNLATFSHWLPGTGPMAAEANSVG